MKVKITKTVDIDSVPKEVRNMIDSAKKDLEHSLVQSFSNVVRDCLSNSAEEFFQSLQSMSEFREDLRKFDENLQEVYNVLEGYRDYLTQPSSDHVPSPEEASDQETHCEEELEKDTSSKEEEERLIMERINSVVENTSNYLKSHGYEMGQKTQEQIDMEQAEYEKLMSRIDGTDEVENEEG